MPNDPEKLAAVKEFEHTGETLGQLQASYRACLQAKRPWGVLLSRPAVLLSPPRSGWLPFRLELGDLVIEDWASNVLNDPMRSLLDLFRFTVQGGPQAPRVDLWLEPEGYALDTFSTDDHTHVIVRVEYDPDGFPPMDGDSQIVYECTVATDVFSGALRDGLATVLEGPGSEAFDEWGASHEESLSTYLHRFHSSRHSK